MHIEKTDKTIMGWDKKPAKKPTSFMMTTKFINIMTLTVQGYRQLARPLKDYQREYLIALDVPVEAYTEP